MYTERERERERELETSAHFNPSNPIASTYFTFPKTSRETWSGDNRDDPSPQMLERERQRENRETERQRDRDR